MEPTGEDIWLYRNQPYGLWKSGNPYVKASIILSLFISTIFMEVSIMVQTSILALFLIYAPSHQNTKTFNIIINFGLSGIIITGAGKLIRLYPHSSIISIKNIADIDVMRVLGMLFVFFAFVSMGRAITSRDIAWIIDFFGEHWREIFGSFCFTYIYAFVRWPAIIASTTRNINARGGCRILKIPMCHKRSDYSDRIGLLLYNFKCFMDDMTSNIEYLIPSRIKLIERANPSRRAWTVTDVSILGSLTLSVLLSRWI